MLHILAKKNVNALLHSFVEDPGAEYRKSLFNKECGEIAVFSGKLEDKLKNLLLVTDECLGATISTPEQFRLFVRPL